MRGTGRRLVPFQASQLEHGGKPGTHNYLLSFVTRDRLTVDTGKIVAMTLFMRTR